MSTAGDLGDSHELSERARRYANEIIDGDAWPLSAEHVALDRVTFETSTRMKRKHGVCSYSGDGRCTIRLSEKTHRRAGFKAMKETIRHELVHAMQHQTEGVETGHGASFKRWVEPLGLTGRCSRHYDVEESDYEYTFHCEDGCGFIGGRYRMCKTVRAAVDGGLYCRRCDSRDIAVRRDGRVLTTADLE